MVRDVVLTGWTFPPRAGNRSPGLPLNAAQTDRARRGGLYRETESSRRLRSRTQLPAHLAIRVLFTVHVDVELVVVVRKEVRVVDERAVRHREGIRTGLGQGYDDGAVRPSFPAMNMGRGWGEPVDRDGADGLRAGERTGGRRTLGLVDDDVGRAREVAAHGRHLLRSGEPGNGHPSAGCRSFGASSPNKHCNPKGPQKTPFLARSECRHRWLPPSVR